MMHSKLLSGVAALTLATGAVLTSVGPHRRHGLARWVAPRFRMGRRSSRRSRRRSVGGSNGAAVGAWLL